MHSSRVAAQLDALERLLLRIIPGCATFFLHELSLQRLEERFRHRVVPRVPRSRYRLRDPVRFQAALECPRRALSPLVVMENQEVAVRRILPPNRLARGIHPRVDVENPVGEVFAQIV